MTGETGAPYRVGAVAYKAQVVKKLVVTVMMRPHAARFMAGTAARVRYQAPEKLTATTTLTRMDSMTGIRTGSH